MFKSFIFLVLQGFDCSQSRHYPSLISLRPQSSLVETIPDYSIPVSLLFTLRAVPIPPNIMFHCFLLIVCTAICFLHCFCFFPLLSSPPLLSSQSPRGITLDHFLELYRAAAPVYRCARTASLLPPPSPVFSALSSSLHPCHRCCSLPRARVRLVVSL